MCLYPKLIKNRKYVSNKKNGGNVPHMKDKRVQLVPVGCGKCMECRKQRARAWQVRLTEDIRHNKNGHFVTLTFSNESLIELREGIKGLTGYELDNEIATIAVRRFLERWRKRNKKSVRHWLVTELGQNNTERIHLHGIIWTDKPEELEEVWKYGKTDTGKYVNERTVNYIVKYVSKSDELHKEYKPKILTSPGIGKNYLERHDSKNNAYKKEETIETYRTRTGVKLNLPVYYRNKLYTEEEREELWIQKLDQEQRWVNGTRIDTSQGEDEYYAALEEARRKNKELGYGDNKIDWERRKYERERRNLVKWKKIYGSKKKG